MVHEITIPSENSRTSLKDSTTSDQDTKFITSTTEAPSNDPLPSLKNVTTLSNVISTTGSTATLRTNSTTVSSEISSSTENQNLTRTIDQVITSTIGIKIEKLQPKSDCDDEDNCFQGSGHFGSGQSGDENISSDSSTTVFNSATENPTIIYEKTYPTTYPGRDQQNKVVF